MTTPVVKVAAIGMGFVAAIGVGVGIFLSSTGSEDAPAPQPAATVVDVADPQPEAEPVKTPPITPKTRRAAVKTAVPIDREKVTKVPRKAMDETDEE